MKNYLIAIISFVSINGYSQAEHPVFIENGEAYNKQKVNPFLDSLHNSNDYVLSFRVISNWLYLGYSLRSFILVKKQNDLSAYTLTIEFPEKFRQFDKFDLTPDSLEQLWLSYVNNDLFRIKTQRDLPHNCSFSVSDLGIYEFILLTKDKMKILQFDAPEVYLKHCDDLPERKNVVNCAAIINRILK